MSVFSGYVRYFTILISCWMIWSGCNIVNPVEPTPTFVHIDSFRFNINSGLKNKSYTRSHNINNVWVYYNNNLIGEYDLPATFPVITDGTNTGKLELFPGISVNGLNNSLDIYPFYEPDTSFVLASQPGKTITYEPVTQYYSDAKITGISNFDIGGITGLNFGLAGGNVNILPVYYPDALVFEGSVTQNGSGCITLITPGVDSSVDSSTRFTVNTGVSAYIEFNYKSDVPFYVGMASNLTTTVGSSAFYLAGINPSSTWQKFYLNITAFIAQYQGVNYNFYIKTSLPGPQTPGRLLIDNIQLVTF